jgi:murein peptide amidase A
VVKASPPTWIGASPQWRDRRTMIHSAHDYQDLIRRWRLVARKAGLHLTSFAQAGDFKLYYLRTPALPAKSGVYISAGIHGDEPATTEGLITWAERHTDKLAEFPLLLFPCLNPWGLRLNIRLDQTGVDLNRAFDRDDVPVIAAVRSLMKGQRFTVALHLHEDYDAQGIYLYEVEGELPYWGESLLRAARGIIPIDPRSKIDTGKARTGVIRRRLGARHFTQLGGLPEAVYLHRHHTTHAITFETPSEYALDQRIAAHVAVIEAAIRRATSASGSH